LKGEKQEKKKCFKKRREGTQVFKVGEFRKNAQRSDLSPCEKLGNIKG